MCGIFAILDSSIDRKNLKCCIESVYRRGPDYNSDLEEHVTSRGNKIWTASSVLHLRGDVVQIQPVIDIQGNILMFNGQIYGYTSFQMNPDESDTVDLFDKLRSCATKQEIVNHISSIDGPFALIYWHDKFSTLFYGRDIFGRKSLCELKDENENIILLSSVATRNLEVDGCSWSEVICPGLFTLDFSEDRRNPIKTFYSYNLSQIFPRTDKCSSPLNILTNHEHIDIKIDHIKSLNRAHNDNQAISVATGVAGLDSNLRKAVSKRVKYSKPKCLLCRSDKQSSQSCDHSKVAVAFSGGLDSTLLALYISMELDPEETIDLLTVSFKDNSPDRNAVGSAFIELKALHPTRRWRLVVCDVRLQELRKHRDCRIGDLIWPCKTVIDDSLGCACWFIARGEGRSIDSIIPGDEFEDRLSYFLAFNPGRHIVVDSEYERNYYYSPASMIFSGSGIDEQLGGYSSHRAAWFKAGHEGVNEEISFQMRRISSRNLGRDDRVFSDHGRDLKLPYLDFDLLSYLNTLPVELKLDFNLESNYGPKKILRDLAINHGLKETSMKQKRALQFGTRIANLEDTQEKGNDICQRLIKQVEEV